jgi:steroid 5-alpha reductase family enzyme
VTGFPWQDVVRLAAMGAAVVLPLMFALWLLHLRLGNAAVVDVGWAFSLGVLAVLAAVAGTGDPVRRAIVALVGGSWSARLTWHLVRRVASEPEDPRYAELRARWGGGLRAKFLAFFLFQGVLCLVLAIPFLTAAVDATPRIHWITWAGVVLAAVSVVGEGVADAQLRRFRADAANRGRVCRAGLWGWSRHPNYFFDWLIWCAFVLIALPSPMGWLGVVAPVLMLHFLTRVTGIPATEAHALRSRGEEYARYQREVSAFVPWPPRVEK